MTPHELMAEGKFREAIADLESRSFMDASDRLLLVQALLFAGRFSASRSHLARIVSSDEGWPELARQLRLLIRAEWFRLRGRRPMLIAGPPPSHLRFRWKAIRALRVQQHDIASRWIDRADLASPEIRGFLDGQEFDALRDADDRYASVLEAMIDGDYVWLPWEGIRSVRLAAVKHARDRMTRPADVKLIDGRTLRMHIPLIYPKSFQAHDELAMGLDTDFTSPGAGLTTCLGGKLLLVGDSAEVPLAELTMIEIRPSTVTIV